MEILLIDRLIYTITNRPNDWKFEDYRITHTPSGVELWIDSSIRIRKPFELDIGWLKSRKFIKLIKELKAKRLREMITF